MQSQSARSVEQVSVFKTMVDNDLLIAQFVPLKSEKTLYEHRLREGRKHRM